jgi:hypothetical protein
LNLRGFVLILLAAALPASAQTIPEPDWKSAFLCNLFVDRYVSWPRESRPAAGAKWKLGILGKDPLGETLDGLVKKKAAQGLLLEVLRSEKVDDLAACNVVFVADSEKANARAVLQAFEGKAVILVGESAGFAELGGLLNFYKERVGADTYIKPELNHDALKRIEGKGIQLQGSFLALIERVGRKVKDGP